MDNVAAPDPNESEGATVEASDSKPTSASSSSAPSRARAAQQSTEPVPQIPAPPGAEKKWYIVNTYSGHENKARLTLKERVVNAGLSEFFGEVLVPTESVSEVVKGQRRTMTRKFFPGYMFVNMILDDRTFHLVKNTPKITGFLGGTKPSPVPEREITGVQQNTGEGGKPKPKARVVFEPGDTVRVIDGPFANFTATVEEVKQDKQKVKVLLSMFGRSTSTELDFDKVEKA